MKKLRRACLCLILCLLFSQSVYASENHGMDKKAIVFLLDASGSMKTNDPQKYAVDSIAQLIYTLPTDYEVGFVAYNTEICATQPFLGNSQRSRIMESAQSVSYENYSNAGAGLLQAVEMLQSCSADDKSIVMLSDGEFLMEDGELTEQSYRTYQEAVEKAVQEEITIHVIGLGKDMENTENSIFQAAAQTEGGIYYTPHALDLPSAMESILTEQLGIRQMTAALIDTDGDSEQIPLELPFAHANTIRVLLTSDSPIQNVKTNFKADSADQITGERYSLIEIKNPQSSHLEVSFTGTAGKQVQITLIPEYQVIPKVTVAYEDRVPSDDAADRYERDAILEYTFFDADNESIQLWTEEYFEYGRICIQTGQITEEKVLEGGRLTCRIPVNEKLVQNIHFDCSELPVNVLSMPDIELEFEEAPLLPVPESVPEPDPPYAVYGILAATIAGILAVLMFRRSGTASEAECVSVQDDRPAPGKSSYVGKLNIYITRAPSGYDIEPLSYNLFRLPSTKVISMAEVLESCGIKEIFEGAGRIYLNSGQGRSIVLTNQSDCCIMKSGEILMKQKSYPLYEDAKVDITFEDEVSELTFQYKVLKPSEMV
jgi:hypothetical protein